MKKISKHFYLIPLLVIFIFSIGYGNSYGKSFFYKASVVRQQCAACHKSDSDGAIEVIEETRKTPEEWNAVITRMIRLNSAPVEESKFYPVIKELSKYLCLSPQEMAKVSYINSDENSQYREIPANKEEERIYTACVRCHTYGKIASHRMTESQWEETRNLHLGYYPTTVPQMREMDWPKESKELVKPLSNLFPFDSPSWKKWLKNRKEQNLSGKWKTAGYQPGMGYYEGTYTFKANPAKGEDEYFIEKQIKYENGTIIKMGGEATLYGEYHLRYRLAPSSLMGRIEGVFDLNVADNEFRGKWWTVIQDSNAYGDETFVKLGNKLNVIAHYPGALKADSNSVQNLTLIGTNFPSKISKKDIKFSDSNVKIEKLKRIDSTKLICALRVANKTAVGKRVLTLKVKKAAYKQGITVFDQIDGIEIFPAIGRARVSSGAAYPPHGVQFVTRAINFGKDLKPNTKDDLILEPVDAQWALEEVVTRENDDDLKYLNAPITNGLYTPVSTYGPIEERAQRREGVGLIGVRASYGSLKAKARLVVTVPDFIPHIK
ncbi:MAG: quinohemoprotein amine dehydrogenase subunit alpha [Desulfobacula sp.]|jgi:quinohemoprotein amine dehydrogenase|nr:quinohemoprotein amine dehydrogenase subunit alpha [Desulfobacula sp.]